MTGRGGVGGHCRGGLGLHQTGRVAVFIGRAEHLYVVKSCFVALKRKIFFVFLQFNSSSHNITVVFFIKPTSEMFVTFHQELHLCDFERELSVVDVSWTVAGRAPVGDVVHVGKLGELLVHLVH